MCNEQLLILNYKEIFISRKICFVFRCSLTNMIIIRRVHTILTIPMNCVQILLNKRKQWLEIWKEMTIIMIVNNSAVIFPVKYVSEFIELTIYLKHRVSVMMSCFAMDSLLILPIQRRSCNFFLSFQWR